MSLRMSRRFPPSDRQCTEDPKTRQRIFATVNILPSKTSFINPTLPFIVFANVTCSVGSTHHEHAVELKGNITSPRFTSHHGPARHSRSFSEHCSSNLPSETRLTELLGRVFRSVESTLDSVIASGVSVEALQAPAGLSALESATNRRVASELQTSLDDQWRKNRSLRRLFVRPPRWPGPLPSGCTSAQRKATNTPSTPLSGLIPTDRNGYRFGDEGERLHFNKIYAAVAHCFSPRRSTSHPSSCTDDHETDKGHRGSSETYVKSPLTSILSVGVHTTPENLTESASEHLTESESVREHHAESASIDWSAFNPWQTIVSTRTVFV